MLNYNNDIYRFNEHTYNYIEKLCNLILVKEGENLDSEQCKIFVENFFEFETPPNGEKQDIRNFVQQKVNAYIESIPLGNPLFVFASDNGYLKYRNYFRDCFDECNVNLNKKGKSKVRFPEQFDYVFDYIQEVIDLHTLYEKFSTKMTGDAVAQAKKEAEKASKNASDAAIMAQIEATTAADTAASKAISKVLEDKRIETEIESKVDTHMSKVTSKVTETSVVILGIFSGIVLTVIAGFIYSSSVIDNIINANVPELICTSSLVGFVCIQLIAIMFFFIVGISKSSNSKKEKGKEKDNHKINYLFPKIIYIVISVILIAIMIIFAYIPTSLKEQDKNNKQDLNNQITSTAPTQISTISKSDFCYDN